MWNIMNPRLVQWDFGKEITVTLTDALMSLESLRFMMGGAIKTSDEKDVVVHHTAELICGAGGKFTDYPKDTTTGIEFNGTTAPLPKARKDHPIRFINITRGWRTQIEPEENNVYWEFNKNSVLTFNNPKMIAGSTIETTYQTTVNEVETTVSTTMTVHENTAQENDHIRMFWDEIVTNGTNGETAVEVTISPDTFPGTYRVIGDTFMRNSKGKDEPFQFVINRAKVQSNVTLTLEAEGDPSTFELSLNVLRSNDSSGNEMMKLIRYQLGTDESGESIGNDKGSLSTYTIQTVTAATTSQDDHQG